MRKKKKKKSNKKGFFIFIVLLITIGIALKVYIGSTNKEIADKSSKTLKSDKEEITEESSFPEEVFGVPVYTDLIESCRTRVFTMIP